MVLDCDRHYAQAAERSRRKLEWQQARKDRLEKCARGEMHLAHDCLPTSVWDIIPKTTSYSVYTVAKNDVTFFFGMSGTVLPHVSQLE